MTAHERTLAEGSDADAIHKAAWGRGELVVQQCTACEELRWPPAPICPRCLATGAEWSSVGSHGSVATFCTYRRDLGAGLPVPYTVAFIDLGDNIHMYGKLSTGHHRADVGSLVHAEFVTGDDGLTTLHWRLDEQAFA